MSKLFQLLEDRGLIADSPDKIATRIKKYWPGKRIFILLDEMNEAIEERPPIDSALPLSFFASGSFGCGRRPCSQVDCRREAADNLGRMAALFADKIIIPQPFPTLGMNHREASLQRRLIEDITVLSDLRTICDSGIVQIVRGSDCCVCPHCLSAQIADNIDFTKRIRSVEDKIKDAIIKEVHFKIKDYNLPVIVLEITGPEKWVPHGRVLYQTNLEHYPPMKDFLVRNQKISPKMAERLHLYNTILEDSFENIASKSMYTENHRLALLSDVEVDFEVLRLMSNSQERGITDTVLSTLSHELPFPASVDINNIIKLRQNENEAFQVYRDKLRACLIKVADKEDINLQDVLQDEIIPEVNKIELIFKNNRKALLGSTARELILGGAFISIGLFAGFLDPSARVALGAIGGYEFISSIAAKASDVLGAPKEVKDNPFYFLWKAKKYFGNKN